MIPPTLVGRESSCQVCAAVAMVEDVNVRLFNERFEPLHPAEAVAYVKSVGMAGTTSSLTKKVLAHQAHVRRFLEAPGAAPGAVTRIAPAGGPASWLRVNDQAMAVGMEALRSIASRLEGGDLDADQELAVARLGLAAAHKRADAESRGRVMREQTDELLRLVAGYEDDATG